MIPHKMLSAADAELKGFASFNNGDHLCFEIPDGHTTISVRTSEGKLVTFAFVPYKADGPPQCVDVHHKTGGPCEVNKFGGRAGDVVEHQRVIAFSGGGTAYRSSTSDKLPCSLITVVLTDEREEP